MTKPFDYFAAIDWSGEATERPRGLAMAIAGRDDRAPKLLRPDGGWSRAAITRWLAAQAEAGNRILVGMDLSPAFPFVDEGAYFPQWDRSPADARALWAMVDHLTRDDPHLSVGSMLRAPEVKRHFRLRGECGDLFPAGRGRLRICEYRQAAMGLSPYSCFNLVGAAQVGKSSLTGMRTLHRLNGLIPVWPFDALPSNGPVIVEIYTALAARAANIPKGRSKMRDAVALDAALAAFGSPAHIPLARYDDHATDAILTAAWLRHVADDRRLWTPDGMTGKIASTEGWTFGVI